MKKQLTLAVLTLGSFVMAAPLSSALGQDAKPTQDTAAPDANSGKQDGKMDHSKMDHSKMGHGKMDHSKMGHGKMAGDTTSTDAKGKKKKSGDATSDSTTSGKNQ